MLQIGITNANVILRVLQKHPNLESVTTARELFVINGRRESIACNDRQRLPSQLLARFPTTLILSITYGPFVLLPGLLSGTLGPSMWLVGLGAVSALAVEAFLARLSIWRPSPVPFSVRSIRWVTWTGVAATAISALGGARSFRAQLRGEERTWLASSTTPLVPLVVIGLALAIICYATGQMTRRQLAMLLVPSLGICFAVAFAGGILGSVSLVMFPLLVLAMLLRLVRIRLVVLFAVGLVFLWPVIHHYRNQIRLDAGVTEAQLGGGAYDRFSVDRQLALLDQYGRQEVYLPSMVTVLRYGLLPSAVDRGRPPLIVGQEINAAYGGVGRSATSLTLFGNVYIAAGWSGVMFFGVSVSAALRLLLRGSACALVIATLLIETMLSIDSTYPVSIAAFFQQLVAFAGVYIATTLLGGMSSSTRLTRS